MGSGLEHTQEDFIFTLVSFCMGNVLEEEFSWTNHRGTSMRACGKMISNGDLEQKQITRSRCKEEAILNEECRMDVAKLLACIRLRTLSTMEKSKMAIFTGKVVIGTVKGIDTKESGEMD